MSGARKTGEGRGDWMITASGVRFFPLDPHPEDIRITDIAHQLARVCRYGGAVDAEHYSVAEHSCLIADWFEAKGDRVGARWGLLHDGAEAYIGDLIRPIKPDLPQFKAIELPLEHMIWRKFGLHGDRPPRVKAADVAIVADERQAMFAPEALAAAGWVVKDQPLGVTPIGWRPREARDQFMRRFFAWFPGVIAS